MSSVRGRRLRFLLAWVLPPLALAAWALAPVIAGQETFFLRDLFSTHLEMRHAVAAGLADGRLPLVDPARDGQPLAGNPNAVAFYPTALLHLVLPLLAAVNAHLLLHLAVAPFALYWLGRELGLERRPAWAAAVFYGFSGFLASQLTFFNLIAAVALAPALAAACHRTVRTAGAGAAATAGAVWALVLLGGDPMTAAAALAAAGGAALLALPPPGVAGSAGTTAASAGGNPAAPTTATATPAANATASRAATRAALRARIRAARRAATRATLRALRAALPPAGRRALLLLAAGLAAGTLVALPQIVELLRVLPGSSRAWFGYTEAVRTTGSLDPRQALEWLLPFAYGRPDRVGPGEFWGHRFHQGTFPFLFTLYPGLLALALVAAAPWPRWRRRGAAAGGAAGGGTGPAPQRPDPAERVAVFGWALAAAGLFLALGRFNPVVAALLALPGADVLRYPVKLWLLAAVGLSLLCGAGFAGAVLERRPGPRRRLVVALAALATLYAAGWVALHLVPDAAAAGLAALMPGGGSPEAARFEVRRWSGLCLLSAAAAFALLALLRVGRRWPGLGGALLLAAHAALQLFFLAPAAPTDAARPYLQPVPLLDALPPDELVVHGEYEDLFGEAGDDATRYPSPHAFWVYRRTFHEAYPFAGALHGRRYTLDDSPEGLDPALSRYAGAVVEEADGDRQRLRLLAAWGVGRLVLARELAPEGLVAAAEVAAVPSFGHTVRVYRLRHPAPEVHLATRVLPVDGAAAAVRMLLDARFRPGQDVVLFDDPVLEDEMLFGDTAADAEEEPVPPRRTRPAERRVEVVAGGPEHLAVEVRSEVPGVLVWQRAYSPLWRASVDGRPAPVEAANLHRLGVPVPAGRHRVRVWIDRRPLAAASAGSAAGLLALAGLAAAGLRQRRRRRLPSAGELLEPSGVEGEAHGGGGRPASGDGKMDSA